MTREEVLAWMRSESESLRHELAEDQYDEIIFGPGQREIDEHELAILDAAIALLEAEPRKPDGWAEGNWRDKMRRHRVISLYATREADSDMPVYIGAQPEVEP